MWKFYDVSIKVNDRLVGGIPRTEKLIDNWLAARAPSKAPAGAVSLVELAEQVAGEVDAQPEVMAVGFKRQDGQVYIEGRQIKAMLKEAANILKGPQFLDVKNAMSKLAERVFVEPDKLFIAPLDAVKEEERPVHVMTRLGPRTSLKRYEYVVGPFVEFRLRVLADGIFGEEDLRTMLEYAQFNGLGADRSQGEGTFTLVSLIESV